MLSIAGAGLSNSPTLSPADYLDIKAQTSSFAAFGAYQRQSVNIGRENAQGAVAVAGTSDVLRAFGVQPALGRFFEPEDDIPAVPERVILSHALWQQFFAGNPQALGQTMRINGSDCTVIGVMPEGFEFVSPWARTTDVQLWLPLSLESRKTARDSHYLLGIARLKDGMAVESANAEVKNLGQRLKELHPNSNTHKPLLVRSPYHEMTSHKAPKLEAWS